LGQDEPEGGTGEVAAPVSSKRSGFGTDMREFYTTPAQSSNFFKFEPFHDNLLRYQHLFLDHTILFLASLHAFINHT
jgi:hypothetical protein